MIRLRLLDPGRIRLRTAVRTVAAAIAALLATSVLTRAAGLPGGMVAIATVVAVMVARSLRGASLVHRLWALLYVPAVGVAASFVGRLMARHVWFGAVAFLAAVGGSRYLLRFGPRTRFLGRLALTPLIAVLVTPVPPDAARSTGPLWGAACGAIAVACVIASEYVLAARPLNEAAAAAADAAGAAARLPAASAGPRRERALLLVHRASQAAQDRLDAARLPDGAGRSPADDLAVALLALEVRAQELPADGVRGSEPPAGSPAGLRAAVDRLRECAAAVRGLPAVERPAAPVAAPRARAGGLRDPHPQARLTAQLVAAMGAAFAAGHLLFGRHWPWAVITAFVVCGAARGRGDVVHRSALRVLGACTGAVAGTLVARTVPAEPPLAVAVIFCFLLTGLWLREATYAAWAFCVTGLLAVLYSLDGEHGTSSLLLVRPEAILVGSACGIAAACAVLPLRTETVLRGRAARALRALQELLAAAREETPDPNALRHLARRFDRAVHDLAAVVAPARLHRRLRGTRSRAGAHPADWADLVAACAHPARALPLLPPDDLVGARAQLGLTARNLGQVRRRLGRRPDAQPPRPPRSGPACLLRLNALLCELYDSLAAPQPPPASPEPSPAPAAAG